MVNSTDNKIDNVKMAIDAVDNNDVKTLKKIIENGFSINTLIVPKKFLFPVPLLNYAIQMQKPEIVNFLLSQENIDLKPQNFETPLRTALYSDNDEIYYNVINKHIDKYGNLSQDEIDKMLFACIERNLSKGCHRTLDLGANPDRSFKLKGQDKKHQMSFLTYSITKDKNNVIIPMIEKYWENIKEQCENKQNENDLIDIFNNAKSRINGFAGIANIYGCSLETYKKIVDKCCEIFESDDFYKLYTQVGKATLSVPFSEKWYIKELSKEDIKNSYLYDLLQNVQSPIEDKVEYLFSKGLDINKSYSGITYKLFYNLDREYLQGNNDNIIMSLILQNLNSSADKERLESVLILKGSEISFDFKNSSGLTVCDILDGYIKDMDKNNISENEQFIVNLREKLIPKLIEEQEKNQSIE